MKSMLLTAVLLSSVGAHADWICEALCPTGDGFKLVAKHANHPTDALQLITDYCKLNYGTGDQARDSGRIYLSVSTQPWTQASVGNACQQVNSICY